VNACGPLEPGGAGGLLTCAPLALAALVCSIVHVLLDQSLARAPAGRARDAEPLALGHAVRALRR